MILLSTQASPEGTDGDLRKAVWQPAGLGISLFRPHGHPGPSALAHSPGEHRPFLPRHPPDPDHRQTSLAPAYRGLPPLGRGLRQETEDSPGVGRERNPQGRLRPPSFATDGPSPSVRRLFHPQEHGTGPLVPFRGSQIPGRRSPLPHSRPVALSLHPLLFLHPRRSPGSDRLVRRFFPPLFHHLLPQRPFLHRARTRARQRPLPQRGQRLSGRGQSPSPTSGRRPSEPSDYSQTTGPLDLGRGPEVFSERPSRHQPESSLLPAAGRILLQLRVPTQFPQIITSSSVPATWDCSASLPTSCP